jgi:hypothetical protein
MSQHHLLRAAASIWDPYWSDTVLLLLGNGSNGSTTIVDSTGKNTITVNGDAQISTSTKKFGTGSLKFDGTGDYLKSYSSESALNTKFGTGDFTVEFWVYFSSTTGNIGLVDAAGSISSSGSGVWFIYKDSSGNIIYGQHNVGGIITASWSPSTSTWYHVAVCRSGGQSRVFIDGTQVGSTTSDSVNFSSTLGIQVGIGASFSALNGNIDDLRITKMARYTANFTAPTRQLPAR